MLTCINRTVIRFLHVCYFLCLNEKCQKSIDNGNVCANVLSDICAENVSDLVSVLDTFCNSIAVYLQPAYPQIKIAHRWHA